MYAQLFCHIRAINATKKTTSVDCMAYVTDGYIGYLGVHRVEVTVAICVPCKTYNSKVTSGSL
jgi:hypothetical protein